MVGKNDINEARNLISSRIYNTPIFHSRILSREAGCSLYFKAENLQKTGSFKIRGAAHFLLRLAKEQTVNGVITASSGNHGQAVAFVSGKAGIPAKVVMPEDAPDSKKEAARAYGAEVILCGTDSQDRLDKAHYLAKENGLVYVPPYDHPYIIAGQGILGLEILEQITHVDAVLVPIGGGGLISGIATAIKEINPKVKVFGVEPERSNSMYMSQQIGKITSKEHINTIADGLKTKQPGKLTFPIVKKYVDDILLVSEQEIKETVKLIMQYQKLVVEPSGATAAAAALFHKIPMKCTNVVSIISGGNMDFSKLHQLVE